MMPKLVMFDLDGTLAESKQPISPRMASLLARLLEEVPAAVVSGAALPQFLKQVAGRLAHGTNIRNLYLLPTSGAALYEWKRDAWSKVYEERISEKDAHTIAAALKAAAQETGVVDFSKKAWGERIEYRGGQVSLSALGQEAPLPEKKAWDPSRGKRRALRVAAAALLPGFSVDIGGATTIDVTKKGVDKGYGVRKLCERLGIKESEALYVGDELEHGGNDEAVYKTQADTREVEDPRETEAFIGTLLSA